MQVHSATCPMDHLAANKINGLHEDLQREHTDNRLPHPDPFHDEIPQRSASIAAKDVSRAEPQTSLQCYQHQLLPQCQRSNCDEPHFFGTPQLGMPKTSRSTTSSPSITLAFRGSHVLTSSPIKTSFPCTHSHLDERSPSPHPFRSLLEPSSSQRLSRNPNLSLVPSLTNLFPSTSAQPSHQTRISHPLLVSLLSIVLSSIG